MSVIVEVPISFDCWLGFSDMPHGREKSAEEPNEEALILEEFCSLTYHVFDYKNKEMKGQNTTLKDGKKLIVCSFRYRKQRE